MCSHAPSGPEHSSMSYGQRTGREVACSTVLSITLTRFVITKQFISVSTRAHITPFNVGAYLTAVVIRVLTTLIMICKELTVCNSHSRYVLPVQKSPSTEVYPGLQAQEVAESESHSSVTELSPHTRPAPADVMHWPARIEVSKFKGTILFTINTKNVRLLYYLQFSHLFTRGTRTEPHTRKAGYTQRVLIQDDDKSYIVRVCG